MYYIYSKQNCPNCVKAKRLLDTYLIQYETIDIEQTEDARTKLASLGLRSVPQVFLNDTLIGGYEKLFEKLVNDY